MSGTGSRWRVLAWGPDDRGKRGGRMYKVGSDIKSEAGPGDVFVSWPGAEFDELVLDAGWLHVEVMDDHVVQVDVAGVRMAVTVGEDGRATAVLVELEPEPGVTYSGEVGG